MRPPAGENLTDETGEEFSSWCPNGDTSSRWSAGCESMRQTMIVPSSDPLTTRNESGDTSNAVIFSLCDSLDWPSFRRLVVFQIATFPSTPPLTIHIPSLDAAMALTATPRFIGGSASRPFSALHSRMVLSSLKALASCLPSGRNTRDDIWPPSPLTLHKTSSYQVNDHSNTPKIQVCAPHLQVVLRRDFAAHPAITQLRWCCWESVIVLVQLQH